MDSDPSYSDSQDNDNLSSSELYNDKFTQVNFKAKTPHIYKRSKGKSEVAFKMLTIFAEFLIFLFIIKNCRCQYNAMYEGCFNSISCQYQDTMC